MAQMPETTVASARRGGLEATGIPPHPPGEPQVVPKLLDDSISLTKDLHRVPADTAKGKTQGL